MVAQSGGDQEVKGVTMVTRVPQLLVCLVKDHPCKYRDQDQGEDQTQGCTRTRTRTRLSLHQMKELLLSSGLNKSPPCISAQSKRD